LDQATDAPFKLILLEFKRKGALLLDMKILRYYNTGNLIIP
jgi:hypothetical protein